MDISKNSLFYRDSPHFKQYYESLKLYYSDDIRKICPATQKPGVKTSQDEKNKLNMTCDGTDWKMNIDAKNSVNLYKIKYSLEGKLSNLLKLLNNEIVKIVIDNKSKDEFKKLRDEYVENENNYDKITALKNDIHIEQQNIIEQNDKLYVKLSKLYLERKNIYNTITENISKSQSKQLIEIYKHEKDDNGKLSRTRVVEISKNMKLKPQTVDSYIAWINCTNSYIKTQYEIYTNNKLYSEYLEKYKILFNNYYLEIPELDETKTILLGDMSIKPQLSPRQEFKESDIDEDEDEDDIKEIDISDVEGSELVSDDNTNSDLESDLESVSEYETEDESDNEVPKSILEEKMEERETELNSDSNSDSNNETNSNDESKSKYETDRNSNSIAPPESIEINSQREMEGGAIEIREIDIPLELLDPKHEKIKIVA